MRYLIYMYIQHECIVLPIWLFVPTKVTCGESPPVFHVRWSTIHTGRHGFRRSDRIGSFFSNPAYQTNNNINKAQRKRNEPNRTEPNGLCRTKDQFLSLFFISSFFLLPVPYPTTYLPTYLYMYSTKVHQSRRLI